MSKEDQAQEGGETAMNSRPTSIPTAGRRDTSETTTTRRHQRPLLPAIDILEREDAWRLLADLPGTSEEDLELTLQGRELKIEATSRQGQAHRAWRRVLNLPADIELQSISARLEQGLLKIELPKKPELQARKVELSPS